MEQAESRQIEARLRRCVSVTGDAWLHSLGLRQGHMPGRRCNPTGCPVTTVTGRLLTARHFRTTLLLAVLRPPWLAVAQLGDGLVVMQIGGTECLLLDRSRPKAENANMVAYLSQPDFAADITVCLVPGITGLAVATDGLEDCTLSQHARRRSSP